ncbi:Aromatic-ring hydroxylase-like protein [Cordyceps fumosorosea ARSEF 2679]|uniref:Aromatic-ring hydroxylase-like protein n=1 Tax=Cordyceps fumosorosea (strain ARSEF 2679) TaxID=1081104 RepID=A0A167LKW6_CORFA|nr:Aromatic-ring hydroxylase-like protein [Cordyceps fumosorosea ARSEF 2679]OAA53202.1 Aromatic-ring hydroxylase-like protein [Cordyceps fumosorosea ARSEF 2679]
MVEQNLHVLIVGAGFGGLTAAIECRRRGMQVTVIETYPTSLAYGDIIDFFPNGGRIIEAWEAGRVGRDLMKVCINQGDKLQYCKADGTMIWEEDWILEPHHFWRQYGGHRGQMHKVMLDYAVELGVAFEYGDRVVQYVDGEKPGVVTASGRQFTADVVVAADGPRSISRQQVLGLPDTKVKSGYAIFRAHFNLTQEHRKNPALEVFCDPTTDTTKLWVGKDLHMVVYTWNHGKDIGWVLTHKDTEDIGESWSFPGRREDVLACLTEGGFEQRLFEVVKATPETNIVDYKLVWRDPLNTWLSPSARIVVIGDAAHCHLPTSAQGGSQAMEDGVALAVCLQRAEGDVPLALRVMERIRFNRSHVTHMASITVRDGYHSFDFDGDEILENPQALNLPRPEWVIEYDIERASEEHFADLAADVKSGKPGSIQELALPAGGDYNLESRKVGPAKIAIR